MLILNVIQFTVIRKLSIFLKKLLPEKKTNSIVISLYQKYFYF